MGSPRGGGAGACRPEPSCRGGSRICPFASPALTAALAHAGSRRTRWNPNAITVENLSGGSARRGARYRGRYRGFGESDLEVIAYEPPRVVTIATTTRMGSGSYSFLIELAGGRATLRQEAQFSLRGPVRLMEPLMGVMLSGRLKQLGAAVKRHLEEARTVGGVTR